ncbi:MAG: gamma-glutamyltransferase, partial [Candidatus Hodarchaeales archaeon]
DAINAPRFNHEQSSNIVAVEEPIQINVKTKLRKKGHKIVDSVGMNFGGGQIIQRTPHGGFIGGSDPRKDGQAQGY